MYKTSFKTSISLSPGSASEGEKGNVSYHLLHSIPQYQRRERLHRWAQDNGIHNGFKLNSNALEFTKLLFIQHTSVTRVCKIVFFSSPSSSSSGWLGSLEQNNNKADRKKLPNTKHVLKNNFFSFRFLFPWIIAYAFFCWVEIVVYQRLYRPPINSKEQRRRIFIFPNTLYPHAHTYTSSRPDNES